MIVGSCPFCNKVKHLEQDHHLSARRLIPKKLRKNVQLLSTKGCSKCHDKIKIDEDFFFASVIFTTKRPDHPIMKDRIQTMLRAFANDHDTWIRNYFLRNVSDLLLPGMGHLTYLDNLRRLHIERYLKYVIKGLHYLEYNSILSKKTVFTCIMNEAFCPSIANALDYIKGKEWSDERQKITARGTFAYCSTRVENCSLWLISFYDTPFLIITQ